MSNDTPPPEGYKWRWIGTCSCRGQDWDCADDDSKWASIAVVPVPTSMVPTNPERDGNGCMIYGKGGTE